MQKMIQNSGIPDLSRIMRQQRRLQSMGTEGAERDGQKANNCTDSKPNDSCSRCHDSESIISRHKNHPKLSRKRHGRKEWRSACECHSATQESREVPIGGQQWAR